MSTVILVTGASGLVGQAIKHVLFDERGDPLFKKRDNEQWYFTNSSEADLRDPQATRQLFEKHKPNAVIHLAALVGGLFQNMTHNLSFLRDNILINDNVLQTSHEHNVNKVISCLSTCVFPDGKGQEDLYPLTEAKIHLGPPHPSNFGYSHAKRLVDIQNKAYKQEFGRNYTSAIPTNVFGPYDNFDLEQAHVIPALIHKCYLAEKNGTVFRPAGSGKPLRQFIYSRDLAKLFIWMLRNYDDVEPLILSVSEQEEVSIEFVVNKIVESLKWNREALIRARRAPDETKHFEVNIEWNRNAADGQFRKPASNDKLLGLLGKAGVKFEFTPFDQALQETVDWFTENYKTGARIGKA